MHLPLRNVKTAGSIRSTSTPLPRPVALTLRTAITRSPASMNSWGFHCQSAPAGFPICLPAYVAIKAPVTLLGVGEVVIKDLDRGVIDRKAGPRVSTFPRFPRRAHHIHALLRHRLLLQAEGGADALTVQLARH